MYIIIVNVFIYKYIFLLEDERKRDSSRKRDGKKEKKDKGYQMFEEEDSDDDQSMYVMWSIISLFNSEINIHIKSTLLVCWFFFCL